MAKQAQQRRPPGWPRLRVADWAETRDTVHMWMQIVGKVRMASAPLVNHWWQATLYVTPRGLTTSAVPYRDGAFDVEFDFVEHVPAFEVATVETARWPWSPSR